jgi:hypothetical protein
MTTDQKWNSRLNKATHEMADRLGWIFYEDVWRFEKEVSPDHSLWMEIENLHFRFPLKYPVRFKLLGWIGMKYLIRRSVLAVEGVLLKFEEDHT